MVDANVKIIEELKSFLNTVIRSSGNKRTFYYQSYRLYQRQKTAIKKDNRDFD